MIEFTEQQIEELKNDCNNWHLVNLRDFSRRLNRALDTTCVRQAFATSTEAFDAFRRYEIVRDFSPKKYPRKTTPLKGEEFVVPAQLDSLDWRWDIVGRHPKYFDFVCARACHWLTPANYVLAQRLFPEINWQVLTSPLHTSVVSMEDKLLFDLNYCAMDVSAASAVTMLAGKTEDECGTILFDNGSEFSLDHLATTSSAMELWDIVDSLDKSDDEKLLLLNQALEFGFEPMDLPQEQEVGIKQAILMGA